MAPKFSIIILAAGASRRMGQPKQLLVLGGESLIRKAVKTALAVSQTQNVIVVLGANHDHIKLELTDLNCQIVINKNWQQGMGTSLKVGLQKALSLNPNIEACLFKLADQPFIKATHLNSIISAFAKYSDKIIAAQYKERLGVPAMIPATIFPFLLSLNEDQGARAIIKANAHLTEGVDFSDVLFDIDTPEDYEKAIRKFNS